MLSTRRRPIYDCENFVVGSNHNCWVIISLSPWCWPGGPRRYNCEARLLCRLEIMDGPGTFITASILLMIVPAFLLNTRCPNYHSLCRSSCTPAFWRLPCWTPDKDSAQLPTLNHTSYSSYLRVITVIRRDYSIDNSWAYDPVWPPSTSSLVACPDGARISGVQCQDSYNYDYNYN